VKPKFAVPSDTTQLFKSALMLGCAAMCLSLSTACREKAETSEETTTDPTELVDGEVNDAAGFKVAVGAKVTYPAFIHPKDSSDWTEECKVEATEVLTSAADKYCVYEGREKDLHFHGGALHYNVPTEMCSYFVVRPYWYYQFETANGPSQVYYSIDKNGNYGIDSNNDGTVETANAVSQASFSGASSTLASIVSGSLTCAYDYTNQDGPNCCLGEYSASVRTWDSSIDVDGDGTAEGGYGDPELESSKWGGNAGDCLSGSAVDTQEKTDDGFPIPDHYYVDGTGINDVYTIASPASKDKSSNLYIANADFGGTSGAKEVDDDLFGDARGTTKRSRYYGFECYDPAFELQARIRVEIQDWNEDAEFALQSAGNPDSNDDPTTDFESTPFGDEPYNDHLDWHTFVDQLGTALAYPKASD
jgi:hypothetical protein